MASRSRSTRAGASLQAEGGDGVDGPVVGCAAGIFVPEGSCAGGIEADEVDPAVAVDVGGVVQERVAVFFGGVEGAWFAQGVGCPVGGLEPVGAGEDVGASVAVDVADGGAFGQEVAGEYVFAEGDGRLPFR